MPHPQPRQLSTSRRCSAFLDDCALISTLPDRSFVSPSTTLTPFPTEPPSRPRVLFPILSTSFPSHSPLPSPPPVTFLLSLLLLLFLPLPPRIFDRITPSRFYFNPLNAVVLSPPPPASLPPPSPRFEELPTPLARPSLPFPFPSLLLLHRYTPSLPWLDTLPSVPPLDRFAVRSPASERPPRA